jgi:hypothetical protein
VTVGGRPQTPHRRWTGIEPAGRGSLVPTALKAAEPTRRSDTSDPDATKPGSATMRPGHDPRLLCLPSIVGHM